MKRILTIIIILSTLSCSKILDKEPPTMYEMDVVLTVEGMNALLNGAYKIMSSSGYYGQLLYLYEAAKGPDFFIRNTPGGPSFYSEARYTHSSRTNANARTQWETIYRAIRNLNVVIENIDNNKVPGNTDDLRRIMGEAFLLRGLCYFDLMRLFAYPPTFSVPGRARYDEEFRWGVPIITTIRRGTTGADFEVRRETADSTYKFIIENFELAYQFLQGRASVPGYANAATAKALLIRAHLYREDWSTVVELGEAWIAEFGGFYSMISHENYPTTYHKPFNSESIWEFGYLPSDNLGNNSLNFWVRRPTWDEPGSERDGTISRNEGYSKLGLTSRHPTRGLDFLEASANDVRRYLICDMGVIIDGQPRKTIRKYVGNPTHSVHNIPVVRLPEVFLSIAEAYANLGNMAQASAFTSLVSQPRRRADANVTSVTHVLDERRRELILEGHTYWDHFRTARHFTNREVVESNNFQVINFGIIPFTATRHSRAVYAVPLSEMDANPAMRDQQNPGYPAWVSIIGEDDE